MARGGAPVDDRHESLPGCLHKTGHPWFPCPLLHRSSRFGRSAGSFLDDLFAHFLGGVGPQKKPRDMSASPDIYIYTYTYVYIYIDVNIYIIMYTQWNGKKVILHNHSIDRCVFVKSQANTLSK